MAKTTFATVDDYVDRQPAETRAVLRKVRAAIRKALRGATETISYQIPAYKVDGEAIIYFAAWKNHYSIYPATATLLARFGEELAPYEISKGTIRFAYRDPVPASLITKLAAFRANETARHRSARSTGLKR
jgi:uncharacterized protein YdhG (YjbR/CyaY superfamily)